ncbi:MAG: pilus assembly protein [Desulfovibrionaceae bacterium]|nr:pilus assembly protein [Desulfovibrionaceae bacterium]
MSFGERMGRPGEGLRIRRRAGVGRQGLGASGGPGPRPGARSRGEAGAVMIEFAFALMFIFLIFTAYVKITEIFLAHSRLRYAAFVASRVHAVHGSARDAADRIDKDFTLTTSDSEVSLKKTVKLPKAVGTLFGTGESFEIGHAVKTFSEPSQSGDNKAN